MPTYEYVCRACGKDLEVVQAFTDANLTTCPTCGGELRKIFGNVGIAFKGSGFYKNDSRPTSSTAKTDATPSGAEKSSSTTEGTPTSTEKKPAASTGSTESSSSTTSDSKTAKAASST